MFGFGKTAEKRGQVKFSDPEVVRLFGLGNGSETITLDQALQVPAVWAAINFLSGTIAGLPLQVFEKTEKGRKPTPKPIAEALGKYPNSTLSSFQWRFDMFSTGVLTEGRFVTYIEKTGGGYDFYPVIDAKCERMADGSRRYYQTLKGGKKKTYAESEVIDITYMLKPDLVTQRSPLRTCSQALAKAYHANAFGAKLFKNGGMPAFMLQGPFGSEKAASRAAVDISGAAKKAAREGGQVLAIPVGHELKPLGSDPEKMQLIEAQRFAVEEVARVYQLPPTFVQDLTHGTFSNTEQQDLQLVKHTIKRWCEQIEGELNLKLFGRGSKLYAEFNLDGLMRGDFMTTMQGNAIGIQSGQISPNETRSKRNLEPKDGGDALFIQGATVPLAGQAGTEEEGKSNET